MRKILLNWPHSLLAKCASELVRRPDVAVLVEMGAKSLGRDDRRTPLYNYHSFQKRGTFGP